MPSTYTTRLRLTLPATGELNNTWGNTVNSGITELLDAAIAGTATISTWGGAGVAYTLSNNNGVADEARCMFIVASGAPGEAKNIICPNVSKLYVVTNSVSGGFSVTLKTAAGTGISVENGKTAILRCDGTNVVNAITQLPSFVVAGGTPNQVQFLNASRELTGSANMTFDGTTLSVAALADASLTSGRVTYATTSGNLTDSANLTFDGTSLTLGGNPTLSAGTANGVLYLNGSKVATSGSALQFSGTYLQTLNGTGIQMQNAGATANWFFETSGLNLSFASAQNGAALWSINGSEQMRLNSTGLGIGTNNPSRRLEVASPTAALVRITSSAGGQTGYAATEFYNAAGFGYVGTESSVAGTLFVGTTAYATILGNTAAYPIQFATNNTVRATLDSSGNLGIGTSSPGTRLHINKASQTPGDTTPSGALLVTNTAAGAAGVEIGSGSPVLGYLQVRNTSNQTYYDFALQPNGGNVGIGTSSPSYKLDITAPNDSTARVRLLTTTGYNILWSSNNSGGTWVGTEGSVGGALMSGTPAWASVITSTVAAPICFGTNTTERMRLDSSGNLGIGTSSPTQKLDVVGNIRGSGNLFAGFGNANASVQVLSSVSAGGSGNSELYLGNATSSTQGYLSYNHASNSLLFGTSTTTKMTLDSSGNLGLGVTPSAWNSGYRAFELGSGALMGQASGADVYFLSNAFFNTSGSWIYRQSGSAGRYTVIGNTHSWHTAPSGTAGNTISFTQAMTLDASGNLLVGTTAPLTGSSRKVLTLNSAAGQLSIVEFGIDGTIGGYVYANSSQLTVSANGASNTSPITFEAGAQERARITSGGDLLVGDTTGNDGRVRVDGTGNANNCAFWGKTSGGATASTAVWWNNTTTGDNLFERFYTEGTATLRGSIDYNRAGGLVRYNTTSDYRAKDIIGPVQNPGATIDALKVYEGRMKGATQTRPMLVAHEAQEVAPYAVSGVKDEVNPDGTPKFQQIDVSSLVPLLLAELQSLRARVAQLERH